MAIKELSQASRTVKFFQVPFFAPDTNLTIPFLMAGKSAGDGGVNSTAAYFMKTANFGFACVNSAKIN